MTKLLWVLIFVLAIASCHSNEAIVVFFDEFDHLPRGPMIPSSGAHTEYHYLPESAPKGNWAVSTFRYSKQNSWYVQDDQEDRVFVQRQTYEDSLHYHPIVAAGDDLWNDYAVEVRFAASAKSPQTGVIVRAANDRCYYFFGVQGDKATLKVVNHAEAFRKPFQRILDEKPFSWDVDKYMVARVEVIGNTIHASFDNGPSLTATDSTFSHGKIGLLSDAPSKYSYVKVTMSGEAKALYDTEREQKDQEERKLQAANPKMKVWKKIDTYGFGVGRNLRFGDLNNDDALDVLIGQVEHHGPTDSHAELSCLTAMTFNGERLWQIGTPDRWKNHLTNDVGFQIHDLDNDGRNEVIYCMNYEIIVADGATGKTKYKAPTPLMPGSKDERILGDCLFFCDLSGKGYASDIVIKDRYHHLWALNDKLQLLWHKECNTGHYPFAYDVDADGKDELMIGYTLFDDDGTVLFTFEDTLQDHADGVAIADVKNNGELMLLCAASDEGLFFSDMKGNMIKHHYLGHVQNPSIANFRDDLPGLEAVSINFWGNQGIIHYYNSAGDIYYEFEPNQFGSMMLPLNWTGKSEEYFVHNPNVDVGGVFDGYGRKVLLFPDDGHPDMCNAVMDITGDCRDEIVVWDPEAIWVYTQDDNPKSGKLYKPRRNPLYNYSNYQVTVSLPEWSE